MIGTIPAALQLVASGIALVFGGWWMALSWLALARPSLSVRLTRPLSWTIIVPAHNEEMLISSTVKSLKAAGATSEEILVVADNCSDDTAGKAAEAGATVLERTDSDLRGKSYALDFALEYVHRRDCPPDGVLFIDADSEVSPNALGVLTERLNQGVDIVQLHYAGAQADAPVARLRRLALSLVHWTRPLGASRLGLPTTLKGNGMAFRWGVIQGGFPGSGITEDAQATLKLLRKGHIVRFEPRASVTGHMATSFSDARTQDMRWEGGRLAMTPQAAGFCLRSILRLRFRHAAAALELASPPLTLVGVCAALGLGLAAAGFGRPWLAGAATTCILLYLTLGLIAARPSAADLRALGSAPPFLAHKLAVFARLTRGRPQSWERTVR